jgi:hypothetical protein
MTRHSISRSESIENLKKKYVEAYLDEKANHIISHPVIIRGVSTKDQMTSTTHLLGQLWKDGMAVIQMDRQIKKKRTTL